MHARLSAGLLAALCTFAALGAALLAGVAVGHHASVDALATTWNPKATVEPSGALDRDRWRDAVERSRRWIPELSGIDF